MAKKRKTFEIEKLKEYANTQLARTDDTATADFKSGVAVMLQRVLFDTNNYNGYQHLYWDKQGYQEWVAAGEPDFPEKYKYIYGGEGKTLEDFKDREYNRRYY